MIPPRSPGGYSIVLSLITASIRYSGISTTSRWASISENTSIPSLLRPISRSSSSANVGLDPCQRKRRRIDDPADPVRVEVETALRNGMPVVPVLVEGAAMPNVEQLPDSLKELVYRNGLEVDAGRDFDQHIERLIRSMEPILARRAEELTEGTDNRPRLRDWLRRRSSGPRRPGRPRAGSSGGGRPKKEKRRTEVARQAEEEKPRAEVARQAEEEKRRAEAARQAEEEKRRAEEGGAPRQYGGPKREAAS